MSLRMAVCVIVGLAGCGQAYAAEDYKISADDSMVIYSGGEQASIDSTDCKADGGRVIADFQQQMTTYKEPGHLVACTLEVVSYYPSVLNTHYYAGIFTLANDGKRSEVAICYNDGVGYLKLEPVAAMTRHELIVYMMDNCTSG